MSHSRLNHAEDKKTSQPSKKKIDEMKKSTLRSRQTSNKDKQTGTAAPSPSACVTPARLGTAVTQHLHEDLRSSTGLFLT